MESFSNLFGNIARWSVYALAALVPVFLVPVSYVTVPQAKLFLVSGLVGVAVVSWLLSSLFAKTIRIPRHAIFFAVPLLPIAYIVSALIAGWPTSAVVSGLAEQDTVVTAILLAIACIVTALTQHERTIMHLVKAFVLGGAVLVCFHIARLVMPDALTLGGVLQNATASIAGTWHDFGIILGLLVILCGSLFFMRDHSKIWQSVFGGVALVSFLLLTVASMQDVWFVLAGTLLLLGVYSWFAGAQPIEGQSSLRRYVQPIVWILLALSAFVLGWYNTWVHDRLPSQLKIESVEVRPSWEGTLSVGQNSLVNSKALVFGTGPNTFARNWAQFKPAGVNETLFWNFDFNNGVGLVPTSFVTIGALGIGAWILIALAFLWTAGMALRKEKLFSAAQTATFGLVCATLFLFAFHVMYAPGIVISILLFMCFGILIAQAPGKEIAISLNTESVRNVFGAAVVVLLSVGTLLTSAVSVRALASEVYVNKSVALFARDGNVGVSSGLVQKALSVWPANDRAHRAAVELGIIELAQLGQKANTDEEAKKQLEATLSQTIEHGLKAISIDKDDYQNWLTLAQLYQELAGVGIEGAYEQAQQAYTSAREENPTNPLPVFRLAQLEVLKGNTSNAIDLFGEAIKLKRDFAPAYFLQSQLLAQQNRLDDAIASGAAAVQLVPNDPVGWYSLGVILYVKGSLNEAGAAFAQAVNLQNDYSNALFMLGLTYYRVGVPDQAIAALARVYELNPNETSIPAMVQNIQAGKDPFQGLTQAGVPNR